ncbi:MAG TPA: alpha/beta hydrolase-fold protein [Nevskiaceae bacterium]|nr:alpha/beta hydrolase-fold protein [Nevskiaceae bacterium]
MARAPAQLIDPEVDAVTEFADANAPAAPSAKATTQGRICVANDVLDDITFSWCMERGATVDRTKILYYLHGAGGNERQLLDSQWYAQVKQGWQAAKVTPPIAIAVSFGPRWTLSDLPSAYVAKHPALFDFFTTRLMPYLEKKITTTALLTAAEKSANPLRVTRRLLMGASMGSYNSALLMERRGDLFKKVVLGCPGLFTSVNPFSSDPDIAAYVTRTRAIDKVVRAGLAILGADESGLTVDDWTRNDPIAQVTQLNATSPALFVWYNDGDQFGFAEGATELSNSAALLGVSVIAPLHNSGGHCAIDPAIEAKIASFLQ